MNNAELIISQAIREAVAAIRLGRRIGRTVPTRLLALSLQVAAEDAERAEAS